MPRGGMCSGNRWLLYVPGGNGKSFGLYQRTCSFMAAKMGISLVFISADGADIGASRLRRSCSSRRRRRSSSNRRHQLLRRNGDGGRHEIRGGQEGRVVGFYRGPEGIQ